MYFRHFFLQIYVEFISCCHSQLDSSCLTGAKKRRCVEEEKERVGELEEVCLKSRNVCALMPTGKMAFVHK